MFEGPEYKSYIALCRELRLEREWQDGDSYGFAHPGHEPIGVEMCGIHQPHHEPPMEWPESWMEAWWLPRLDQWLTMLEEVGVWALILERSEGDAFATDAQVGSGHRAASAPTREEACARLWMAVTGQESAPGQGR